jgi:hypothetical protein
VLGGEAFGGDGVLAAGPDPGTGVQDQGLVAQDMARRGQQGDAGAEQYVAVDGRDGVRAQVGEGLRLVPRSLRRVQVGQRGELVPLGDQLGVGEDRLDRPAGG